MVELWSMARAVASGFVRSLKRIAAVTYEQRAPIRSSFTGIVLVSHLLII
jgi:hypothetical protein